MGGFCSVCLDGQERAKAGAWEELSCDAWAGRSITTDIPTTILVPASKKRGYTEQLTRRRIIVMRKAFRTRDDDEDNDEDGCADDERDGRQNGSVADSCSDSSACENESESGGHSLSFDLLLSDTDCDEGDHDTEEDDNDDEEEDDEEGNLLGESLFSTERDDSDGALDELLLPDPYKEHSLIIMSTLWKPETDMMLQLYPDKESRLVQPSFVEQYNCLGTVL